MTEDIPRRVSSSELEGSKRKVNSFRAGQELRRPERMEGGYALSKGFKRLMDNVVSLGEKKR